MSSVVCRLALVAGASLAVAGCKTPPDSPRPTNSAQPAELSVVRLDYADTDAFDLLFETNLRIAQPVIVVHTGHDKPEWGARLNAWIAAWNAGGQNGGVRGRGQLPAGVVVNGDSVREFRLLIEDLMNRAEGSAQAGTRWWAERSMRDHRIALLRPYNLRFHADAEGHIQLIFFHGRHAAQYKDAVRALAEPGEPDEWTRGYHCSRSKDRSADSATGP
ncbi:MAG TPA: hypothetical protein VMZ71_07795 [Gemmataceae bacterium]|nr:hypothetical protein [Gemmataceae bacterium]